jgi:hypothetical protein
LPGGANADFQANPSLLSPGPPHSRLH